MGRGCSENPFGEAKLVDHDPEECVEPEAEKVVPRDVRSRPAESFDREEENRRGEDSQERPDPGRDDLDDLLRREVMDGEEDLNGEKGGERPRARAQATAP